MTNTSKQKKTGGREALAFGLAIWGAVAARTDLEGVEEWSD